MELQLATQMPQAEPKSKFDQLLDIIMADVEGLAVINRESIYSQFTRFKSIYEAALSNEGPVEEDPRVVSGINMGEFGLEFLSWVDPKFVQDVHENMDWYLNSFRESQ